MHIIPTFYIQRQANNIKEHIFKIVSSVTWLPFFGWSLDKQTEKEESPSKSISFHIMYIIYKTSKTLHIKTRDIHISFIYKLSGNAT